MKSLKRLIAMMIFATMLVSSAMSINIFADEETTTFADVGRDYQYYNAIYTLVKEGVVNGIKQEDGTYLFKPEDTITRAEVATLIALTLVGNETLLASTTDKFPDVPLDHWANKYIAYAVQTGIIAGNDDGTFRPANPVTYGEAVKMLVCAKGYGVVYEQTNPWYEGFVNIANKNGLTKGAAGLGDMEAPRGLVAQLVYNLRSVDYYQPKPQASVGGGGGGGGGGGRVSKDVEEENEEVKGVVTAVFETNLTGEELDLTYKQMMIDDVVYNIGDFKLEKLYNYLGCRVDAEYSVSASGKKTLEKIEVSARNDTLRIKSEDFVGINGKVITYYPVGENKSDDVTLADNLSVVYNGYPVPLTVINEEFIEKYLNVECGEIELISNNNDKAYEVAIVSRYETYFITARTVNDKTYTITDSNFGTSISLNEDDCTIREVTAVNGSANEAKGTAIGVNKVISVAVPYDRTEGTHVIISSAQIKNAEIESVSGEYITLSGKEYKKSAYFEKLIASSEGKKFKMDVGVKGKFFFDYNGDIAYFEKEENKDPYAYVLGFDDGKGLNGMYSMQMFTISGSTATAKVFAFKETVKVNGQNKEPYELGNILKANADLINAKSLENDVEIQNGEYSQLVRYKSTNITIDGESVPCLTEIYTIDPNEPEEGEIVPGVFRTSKDQEKTPFTDGKNRLKYVSSSKAFQDSASSTQFTINTSTVVILVPDDRGDADEYKKRTYSYFTNGSSYDVEPYDIKNNVAGVVLVYTRGVSTKPTVTVTYNIALVHDIRDKENERGKNVKQLSYFNAGDTIPADSKDYKPKTMLTEKSNTLDGVNPGDLIRFAYENNEIVGVQKVFVEGQLYDWKGSGEAVYDVFPAEGNIITHANGSSYPDYYQVVHGTVDSMNIQQDGTGEINVTPGIVEKHEDYVDNWKPYVVNTSTKIYKWNDEDDRFEQIDTSYFVTVADTKDATGASKVVAYKMAATNTLKAIYLLG